MSRCTLKKDVSEPSKFFEKEAFKKRQIDNSDGWKNSWRLVSTFTEGSINNASSKVDFNWRAFGANISLRNSCYKCYYPGKEKFGDY